jgi:hypothetical protein
VSVGENHQRRDLILVTALASCVAIASALPYAGGWNDGSRLATVDSLVDRGTFAIDDSIFVRVPPGSQVYSPEIASLNQTGTLDRLYIDGHYYSDKSPVPAILLAAVYATAHRLAGLSAHDSPAAFCWLMNLIGGGLPYVIAVVAIFILTRLVGLSRQYRWLVTMSFAAATIAPAYARTVNNHIMLLGVTSPILALMFWSELRRDARIVWLAIGGLAGFGYTIDLGIGPVLLASIGGWVTWRGILARRLGPSILFGLSAMPWLLLHHSANYAIAGTIGPANARPEYFNWPGCPFDAATMTGRWHHSSILDFALYSLDLVWGQKGFIGHNLPLALAMLALPVVLRSARPHRGILYFSMLWCGGAFAAYAATSNNFSGLCISVRWFVPMLAPAYLVLALLLRDRPQFARDLTVLTAVNAIWAAIAWQTGWYSSPPLAWHWMIMTAGLGAWGSLYFARLRMMRRRRIESSTDLQKLIDDHLKQHMAFQESARRNQIDSAETR